MQPGEFGTAFKQLLDAGRRLIQIGAGEHPALFVRMVLEQLEAFGPDLPLSLASGHVTDADNDRLIRSGLRKQRFMPFQILCRQLDDRPQTRAKRDSRAAGPCSLRWPW